MEEKLVQDMVHKHGKQKVKAAAKSIKKFIRIYNRLCRSCKVRAMRNPALPHNQLCSKCKSMSEEVFNND